MCRDRNNVELEVGDTVTPYNPDHESSFFNPHVLLKVLAVIGDCVLLQAHSFRGGQPLDPLHRGFYGDTIYKHPAKWFCKYVR